ncbi:peptidoglycan DD-metalloendopeptidase family protein [Vibrio renipiscarius]|uniref:peptidoglycan DD-metalloendopeptidase family protein n=1 Tax=Vibrio renipiscarius TaxID=1461322 RepID=UPI00354E79B9
MSNKILISIPTDQAVQHFSISRTALRTTFALISLLITASIGGVTYYYHQSTLKLASKQQENKTLSKQLTEKETQYATLELLHEEQLDTTHSLSQELEEKRNQLQLLSKRVYDVESVLGLASEKEFDDDNIEYRLDAAAVDSAVRATMFRMIPNESPLNYQRISSSYGRRTNPISGKRHTHTGIDLTCKMGTPIIAPADGVIETVRPSKKGFGNFLTLRHSFGFMTSYAHLKNFKVRSGQFVSKGDVIAHCGNSGNSTGPHLHYEVRFLGRSLNPQYTMDWTPENFNYLFEKEKKVKWAPLVKLIDDNVRLQVNLTNKPTIDHSVETANNELNTDSTVSVQ